MSTDALVQSFANAQFTVLREPGLMVMVARSAQPLGSGRHLDLSLTTLLREVQRAGSGKAPGLLLDFRRAPSRIDEEFEVAFAKMRPHLYAGFTRVAYLMSGTLGKLQAQRYARDDGQGAQAFLNEKLALAFVRPQRVNSIA